MSCPICSRPCHNVVAAGGDFEYQTCTERFTFRACSTCDTLYLSPRPDVSELPRIYPPQYNAFHFHKIGNPLVRRGRRFVQKRKANAIRKLLPEEATVLDVGCGSGELLSLLARFGPRGWRLFGNDFNPTALESVAHLGIETIPGRFEDLEVDMRFDLIVLNQTLEHMEHPARVVRKAADLLKPEGILVVETPCTEGMDARLFRRRYWGGYHIPRHWSLFSRSSVSSLLQANGFSGIEVRFLASPSFWIQSFHHFFLDRRYPRWWVKFWVYRNPVLLAVFTLVDLATAALGRPTSNMRIVAHKR